MFKDLETDNVALPEAGPIIRYTGSDWEALPNILLKEKLANHILDLSDAGYLIQMNSSSSNSLIVPPDSSVNFAQGTKIEVLQVGAGETQIVPGSGVSVEYLDGLKISGQWGLATLIKRSSNNWILSGNLKT